MDPVTALGAAGSVVGIVSFGIQLSRILSNYATQVWYAQESLEEIAEEINLTIAALQGIYSFLKQDSAKVKRGKPLYLFSETSLVKVKETADLCLVVFWRVEATISGNSSSVTIEEELIKKLTDFNEKIQACPPGTSILIESELTKVLLGLRDKLRWPSKASKLDKYCKRLQRYQANLVLLLQVVSLGQQRSKPNPTEEGALLILKTYETIYQIATTKELRIIAAEALGYHQMRYGHEGREYPPNPSHIQQPQSPSGATASNPPLAKVPTNSELPNLNVDHRGDASVPRPIPKKPSATMRRGADQVEGSSSAMDMNTKTGDMSGLPSTSEPTTSLKHQAREVTPSPEIIQEDKSAEKPAEKNKQSINGITQNSTSSTNVQLLPYVIYDGGAYQLPISLEQGFKSQLQGSLSSKHSDKELTEKLAFLSPDQVRTLQNLLRQGSGDQIRRLVHFTVVKKLSMKFWQKPTRVMIAFVEGETSNMPEGVSLVNEPPKDAETRSIEPRQPPLQVIGQQNAKSHILSIAPMSIYQPNQAKGSNTAGLPGFEIVTPLPAHEEEWREKYTKYRVWTIRPKPSIDLREPKSNSWDRCVLSEELLSTPEIRQRLSILDKDSITVLEKMASLTASQQFQITQSIEGAKANTSDSRSQWHLRQLEIIRAKKLLRPRNIKGIVIYVCSIPISRALDPLGKSQKRRVELDRNWQGSTSNDTIDTEDYIAPGGSPTRVHSTSKPVGKSKRRTSSVRNSGNYSDDDLHQSSYSDSSTASQSSRSDVIIRIRVGKAKPHPRRRSEVVSRKEREIERANDDIASRPSRASRPPRRATTPLTRKLSVASRSYRPGPSVRRGRERSRSGSPMGRYNSPPPRSPPRVIIHNRVYARGDDSAEDSTDSGVSSERLRELDERGRTNNDGTLERKREAMLRRPSPPQYFHRPAAPQHRGGGSVSASRSGPHLLEYYNDEEPEEMVRERYPAEFDRQPYDPHLSPQAAAERREAVEQLLLEWTPRQKNKDRHSKDGEDESMAGSLDYETATVGRGHSAAAPEDGQHHPVVTEEPTEIEDETVQAEGGHGTPSPLSETPIVAEKQDTETTTTTAATHAPTGIDQRRSQERPPAPMRRETTDGNGLPAINGQPLSQQRRRQTEDGQPTIRVSHTHNETPDSGMAGSGIPRVSTFPTTSARQAWSDVDWARQIVEETATVADLDEDRGSPRRISEVERKREIIHRELEHLRAESRRMEHDTRRSQGNDGTEAEGSRPRPRPVSPPPPPPPLASRRRTVEFDGLRRPTWRGRERDAYTELDYSHPTRRRERYGDRDAVSAYTERDSRLSRSRGRHGNQDAVSAYTERDSRLSRSRREDWQPSSGYGKDSRHGRH